MFVELLGNPYALEYPNKNCMNETISNTHVEPSEQQRALNPKPLNP